MLFPSHVFFDRLTIPVCFLGTELVTKLPIAFTERSFVDLTTKSTLGTMKLSIASKLTSSIVLATGSIGYPITWSSYQQDLSLQSEIPTILIGRYNLIVTIQRKIVKLICSFLFVFSCLDITDDTCILIQPIELAEQPHVLLFLLSRGNHVCFSRGVTFIIVKDCVEQLCQHVLKCNNAGNTRLRQLVFAVFICRSRVTVFLVVHLEE